MSISKETPVKAPTKRSKIRRVLSSSSTGDPTPQALFDASDDSARPLEIGESPEASSPPAFYPADPENSLFIPDNSLKLPSQDYAVIQPSDPPSSYQVYDSIESSQAATTTLQPASSQPHPSLVQTLHSTGGAVSQEEPAAVATSQTLSEDAGPTDTQCTGRVVPDSQSLGSSLHLTAPAQADLSLNDHTGANEQLFQDLQASTNAPSVNLISIEETAGEERPRSLIEQDHAIQVDASSQGTLIEFSSQIAAGNCEETRQDTSKAVVSPSQRRKATPPVGTTESGNSFPFETQVAPLQTQLEAEQQQRAASFPPQDTNTFPSVPNTHITIGGSAPPQPHIPSTPTHPSAEQYDNMDRQAPTSSEPPNSGLSAHLRAFRDKKAAERKAKAASANSSQVTSAKPSAVPPRLSAELAAESPARNGSPESSRNGVRSPSAVPAALPIHAATQEEMNTSERYKTLLPQQQENASLRRQSTITGTASKETSQPGTFHSVPIALMGHQRDAYPTMIQQHKDMIEKFLGTSQPSEGLVTEIETLLERLRRIVVHPDLDNVETYTQYDVPPIAHAKWAVDCSAKFGFLKHLIDELRDKQVSIVVICQSEQLLQITEKFLLGFKVTCDRVDTGQRSQQEGCALSVSITLPNEDASSDSVSADAIICLVSSVESGTASKLLQEKQDKKLAMMTLVIPGTVEHVERCLSPSLTHQQKLRATVHGVFDLRYDAGKLEHGQLPSLESAKVIADFITSADADKEWSVAALSMLENLDSQTESDIEPPPSSGEKRSFEMTDADLPTTESFKRPRLGGSNGAHEPGEPITINPLELDISRVSDSVNQASNSAMDISSLDSSDLHETNKRLQQLLHAAQARVSDHEQALSDLQYRHEEQRHQLVELTRKHDDAIDTAQKAVERMTEGAATTSALRAETRSLKDQLKAATEALADHSVPDRAALERSRIALSQSQSEKEKLEQRLKTSQGDLDYAQEMYQDSSSSAQRLATTNKELENALAHAQNRASGEQARAKQMSLDERGRNLARENTKLKARDKQLTETLVRKDKEIALLKEASRGRMGTRGTSVPRSPRMASPLKNVAGGGSRQSSPAAGELRGRTQHPLRQG